eukprot:CAMPEP_0113945454 /NCGR_PEP_ID=MMETSP1339-20121228/46090_1 /TAXON_ID=94617 /ORGANISM="Fibrocapsa japonica" /LENGTH=52 /DNA_ID=CAMNT_0000951041 /DNA_START=60 /DNA_END=214 /DNA_ORIENTATION=- /assembly_acc=CAM_ASM_000762
MASFYNHRALDLWVAQQPLEAILFPRQKLAGQKEDCECQHAGETPPLSLSLL